MQKPTEEEIQRRKVSCAGLEAVHNTYETWQIVGINAETVTNVASTDFPWHYPKEDHSWNLDDFKNVSSLS